MHAALGDTNDEQPETGRRRHITRTDGDDISFTSAKSDNCATPTNRYNAKDIEAEKIESYTAFEFFQLFHF